MEVLIFTEANNCTSIGKKAISSFNDFHSMPVLFINNNKDHIGHMETARIFAKQFSSKYEYVIHFDSDVIFREECISDIMDAFKEGYDIVGTRRCYKNNPGMAKGFDRYPDSISTYFFGMRLSKIPKYDLSYFGKMWQGAVHPLGYKILDFGDPVIHSAMANGAKVKYLDQNEYGSQDVMGSKVSKYKSNLHMDFGSKLIHFGGVGTGYAYHNSRNHPHKGYAEWALGRYSLYSKVFFNEDIGYRKDTEYGADGRWINGNYDDNILNQLINDLSS